MLFVAVVWIAAIYNTVASYFLLRAAWHGAHFVFGQDKTAAATHRLEQRRHWKIYLWMWVGNFGFLPLAFLAGIVGA